MKKACLRYGVVLTFLILSAAVLVHVSQSVQQLERDIARYDRAIDQEKEKIRVLKAEWAYLNSPQRLEVMAAGGYGMQTPKAADIVTSGDELSLHPQTQGGRE